MFLEMFDPRDACEHGSSSVEKIKLMRLINRETYGLEAKTERLDSVLSLSLEVAAPRLWKYTIPKLFYLGFSCLRQNQFLFSLVGVFYFFSCL